MLVEKTILIAEDEPKTRNGIRKTLEQWSKGKIRLIPVENGLQALSYMENNPVNLIITDIRMPGITGLSLIDSLRAKQIFVSAIIVSGYAEFDYARKALELQVSSYLLKPVEKSKLIEAVEQALRSDENRTRYMKYEKIADALLIQTDDHKRFVSVPVREMLQYVDDHYYQAISLREAADHIHMNASYVSVLFKEQTDMTFSEYLMRYRIQKAKEYLASTPFTINEIAEKVGYLTARYFIKVFKGQEEMSPNEYRKQWFHNEMTQK